MNRVERTNRLAGWVLPLALVGMVGCTDEQDPAGVGRESGAGRVGPLVVATTFYPTTYFTRRIADSLVERSLIEVVCPLPADADPIFWQPEPEAIATYQQADLIVLNGAGFEKWVEKVSLPGSRVVATASAFEDRWIHYEEAVTHSHGPAGEHSHEGLDGHTWLDPQLAIQQAEAIRAALAGRLPDHASALQAGFEALAADLRDLDAGLAAVTDLAASELPILYASHPAYNYLARAHDWPVVNLDLDPETMPDAETFAAIAAHLEERPARTILWESPPHPEIAARFEAELGLKSIVLPPLETAPEEGDYLSVQRAAIERLRKAFGEGD